jgi:hypothetical protein
MGECFSFFGSFSAFLGGLALTPRPYQSADIWSVAPHSVLGSVSILYPLETGSASLFFECFLPSSAQSFAACFAEVFT